jgi:hypothetical protein
MDWIRRVNPNGFSLEKRMIENEYDGTLSKNPILKLLEDGKSQTARAA